MYTVSVLSYYISVLSLHSPYPLHYSLQGNKIGDVGAKALGEGLQKSTQLETLL